VQGADYHRQLAEIRRRGWRRAAIVTPFLAAAIALGIFTNRAIGTSLDASLYGPACKTTCAAAGSPTNGHRPGGRGERGSVLCDCLEAEARWRKADLSNGGAFDKALHYGGQEALSLLVFATLSVAGFALGFRFAKP
jgi:hypothetical protein